MQRCISPRRVAGILFLCAALSECVRARDRMEPVPGGRDAGRDVPQTTLVSTDPDGGATGAGPPCAIGSTRCSPGGGEVEVCTAGGTWTKRESCSSICAAGACGGQC